MSAVQLRMARAALNVPLKTVANAVEVSYQTILNMELGKQHVKRSTQNKVMEFYKENGIIFVGDSVVHVKAIAEQGVVSKAHKPQPTTIFERMKSLALSGLLS